MPNLPRLPKKPRPNRRPTGQQKKVYNKNKWTRFSAMYRSNNPLCEVSQAEDIVADITPGEKKGVCDHIIQVEKGGAVYDERNIMGMTKAYHDRKTSLEGRGVFDFLVGEVNDYGHRVPTKEERKKVINILLGLEEY